MEKMQIQKMETPWAVILLISVGSLRVQKEAVVEETLSRLLGGTSVRHSTRT